MNIAELTRLSLHSATERHQRELSSFEANQKTSIDIFTLVQLAQTLAPALEDAEFIEAYLRIPQLVSCFLGCSTSVLLTSVYFL